MYALIRDVDYALRTFRKSPVFGTVAVATLALGIGANVAVFSVIDAVVLRPLPYPDPSRLIVVLEANAHEGWPEFPVAWANLQDWQRRSQSLDTIAGFSQNNFTVTGALQPEQIYAYGISRGFMEMLGVQPAIGRLFRSEEYGPEGNAVALISDAFWERQFDRDPDAIGHTLILDGAGVSIVGILPPEAVDAFGQDFRLTVPLSFTARDLTNRASRQLVVYGRLAPEASLDRARVELTAIASELAREFPDTNTDWTVIVQSLTERVVGPVRRQLLAVQSVVLLVLLIAVANVANLLLVRATQREQEISIRAAMGGSRGRIVRQLCTESVLLVAAGGALGLLLAQVLLWALLAEAPALPRVAETTLNVRVFGFAILVSGLSTVLFGLLPAVYSATPNLSETLRSGGSRGSDRQGRSILRDIFTVAEIAVSLVLLSGAGLLVKDLITSLPSSPGFEIGDKLTARLNLQPLKYGGPDQRLAFVDAVVPELDTLPGVLAVAAANFLPFDNYSVRTYVDIEGRTDGPFSDYCAPGFLGHGLRENLMSKEVGGMVQSRRVQGAGSARTEGARRATGVGADAAAAGARALAPGQRWSASRKRDVVLRLLCGESLDAVSRAVGVEIYRLEEWKARALAGLELGLKEQAGEPVAAVLDAAKRHIGALSMENELRRARARAAERRLPLATRRSR